MKWFLLLTLCVVLPVIQAQDLRSYRWKKRPVLLFPGPLLAKQIAVLEKQVSALEERDVVILKIPANEKTLHQKYGVAEGTFTFVLIGKDGGEKFRSENVVSPEALFAIIDAMPMRRDEIKSEQKR